ncbi:type III secretion exporter [Thiorhodococcus drewsii AZ1]|uniref:Flagellar biosynthetic protein FlhB n=1 Tax=Thiorhodococcus drewsii AZ1 TaxID=765913 RepID=G2E359_9GAMM|nr:EscU/YscU/HrcU family type III secretion system export apparatus switch protein [Thiorhodococcus drewsii]EGV30521.1 type III secretion exporter [Thiorhodococcus drewsii AZ1]
MKEKRPSLFAASKAVALRWDGQGAPQITATGSGTTAEQILQIAEAHDIPLQSDPALVEALAQIPIGDEIPKELYIAVAEVLAFIFMLEGIDPRQPDLRPPSQDA